MVDTKTPAAAPLAAPAALAALAPLEHAFSELERLLKDREVGCALAERGLNVSLALVACDGLRAYLDGHHARAAEDLATAAEEIAARYRRASHESPS
ncbi:MAG: hypothetical protein IPF92_04395 [Myxococcales bacterium]|jgi:hypothetical protein|nr:hypothetical protein [Myxococcales bacterium]MBL0197808.1 hypothetical protein [Myxococcales bacterium]HQY60339.1 hypothetical protein [Polyangiaceae bacterium]